MATYAVLIEEGMWRRFRRSAPAAVVREAERIRDEFLRSTPKDTIAAHPRLKPLRGHLRGIWQYDLPGYHRLRYRIDDEALTVVVEYIGPHP